MDNINELNLGDLDIETGYTYCGDQEGYIEVLSVLFEDSEKMKNDIEDYYKAENWNNYKVSVHAVKSSMLSIGALKLSEMAKALELAAKDNDIDYIRQNHDAMIAEYIRVHKILESNPLINPQSDETDDLTDDISNLPELTKIQLIEYIARFETAVYEFDDTEMRNILLELEKYQYQDVSMKQSLSPIKRKVEMMDYMSALDVMKKFNNLH